MSNLGADDSIAKPGSGNAAQPAPAPGPHDDDDNKPVGLEEYRALLGIPLGDPHDSIRPATQRDPPNRWQTLFNMPVQDPEYETSMYFSLIKEETYTWRRYYLYDIFVYACMIAQIIIASALVILGALAGDHHISVAVLGAVTGLITGILSLIKGQGLPNRLLQYADGLRRVREEIEYKERILRSSIKVLVTYGEVMALRNAYDAARIDQTRNRPDVWTSLLPPSGQTNNDSLWKNVIPPGTLPGAGAGAGTGTGAGARNASSQSPGQLEKGLPR